MLQLVLQAKSIPPLCYWTASCWATQQQGQEVESLLHPRMEWCCGAQMMKRLLVGLCASHTVYLMYVQPDHSLAALLDACSWNC